MAAYVAKSVKNKEKLNQKIETAKKFAEEEKLTVIDLQDSYPNIPKLLDSKTNKAISMPNIRAIIIHQDTDVNEDIYSSFIPKVVAGKTPMYHFIIDKEGTIFQLNPVDRAVKHSKFNAYSKKANDYFGEQICPLYENTELSLHAEETSPDFCTISICLPKINEEGDIGNRAYSEACRLIAYLINCYSPALQAQANVLPISFVPKDSGDVREVFSGKKEKFKNFVYETEKIRGHWALYYWKDVINPWPNVYFKKPVEE